MRARVSAVLAVLAVVLPTAGCSGERAPVAAPVPVAVASPAPSPAAHSAKADRDLARYFQSRRIGDRRSCAGPTEDITDHLPNVHWATPAGADATQIAVHGRIVDVVEGVGHRFGAYWRNRPVGFHNPRAASVTTHLLVQVLDPLGSTGLAAGDRITVGLALNKAADLALVRPALLQTESVVLFLDPHSVVFDYAPGLYGIVENGTLLAEVRDGGLDLPGMRAVDAPRAATLLSEVHTLVDLKAAAALPPSARGRGACG